MSDCQNEQKVKSVLSRRGFLQASGLALGTVAIGGLAGCGSTTTIVDTVSSLPSTWEATADIVMVGFGGAAAAATINATGAKVLILEAQAQGGGCTTICGAGTWHGGGTPVQVAAGFTESVEDFYNTTLTVVAAGADPDLVKAYCYNNAATYNMLVNAGVVYKNFVPGYMDEPPLADESLIFDNEPRLVRDGKLTTAVPHLHFAIAGTDPKGNALTRPQTLWQAVSTAALATNPTVLYNMQVTRLIVDDSTGRVVGVAAVKVAPDANGVPQVVDSTELFYKASKAVLLSNGGFISNSTLVAQYMPLEANTIHIGTVMDQGTGLKMGQAVGADTRLLNNAEDYGPVFFQDPSLVKAIIVDQNGDRFAPEDSGGPEMGKWIVYTYPKAWIIIDQTIYNLLVNPEIQFTQADTIADLATAIGTPFLPDTISRYNASASATPPVDSQFNKDPAQVQPIQTGPFYALAVTPETSVMSQTIGGLRINANAQVLKSDGTAIPGLYAAGAVTSHIHAQYYAAGGSTGGAFTFGRIAGLQMITETPWDSSTT
jgi:3-oxo-5alpha-steroid 4-dehydrogenase